MSDDNIFEQYAELVRKFKSGDESAFTEIYENSSKLVYITCLGILNNEQDAEDAMQETYLTVYEKLGSLEAETTFVTWLKTIAANKARDKFKAKRNDASFDDVLATEENIEGDDNLENLPDALILEKDKRNTFYKIIRNALSDEQFQTTILYYYDELPVSRIAQIMECPENTVKSKLRLARVKIKAGIEEYEKTNKISLLGAAAGTGSLGNFFNAYYSTVKVPAIKGLPGKVGVGVKGAAGKVAAKAGAKAGHAAAGATAKAAATSSVPKVLAIVGASVLGAGVIGGAIYAVTALNQKEDEEPQKTYEIEYDGLYCNIDKSDDITKCLRFYSDGKFISTEYEYGSDSYFPDGGWFNLDTGDDRVIEGTYDVDGNKITISYDDDELTGEIMKNSIYIDDLKYKYYEFDDIDGYIPDVNNAVTPTDTTDPADPTDPTVKTGPVSPISGAYLDILYQHKDGILTYETLGSPSINYIDITNDGINELMFFYYDSYSPELRLAVYTYNAETESAELIMDRSGDCIGAVLLDNGNILYQSYLDRSDELGFEAFDMHILEVETNGSEGVVIDDWSCDQGYNAYHNGDSVGSADVYQEVFREYKTHMVLPVMPYHTTFKNYQDPAYTYEMALMSREIFEAGDYYYYADLVALLGGSSDSSAANPATGNTPVASLPNEIKEAYLAKVNSITVNDFADLEFGIAPEAGEITFDLVYINDDDIPELICSCSEYVSAPRFEGYRTYTNIYTYANGKVIELCRKLLANTNDSVSNFANAVYYYRENLVVSDGFESNGMHYYEYAYTYVISDDCTAINKSYYVSGDSLSVDYSAGFPELRNDAADGKYHYYSVELPSYSDYKEITETEYNAATTGKGDRIPLVATKTNNEITLELS